MATQINSKTIVLVHGMFVNPKSWEDWKPFFEAQGYTVHTPANPHHAGEPADLRANVNQGLRQVDFKDVVDNLVRFIDTLPEKPILIGHSLGGLTVQKLVELDKAVAAVVIDSVPPLGVITTKWSFLKSLWPVINPFKGNSVFEASKSWFAYTFGNTLSRTDSDRAFDKYVVPESRGIGRGALTLFAKINFKKPHVPLLFVAGEKDNIMPASLNKSNFKAYKDPNSVREFKEFPGRSHFICGEPGWEEVAGYVFNWIKGLK